MQMQFFHHKLIQPTVLINNNSKINSYISNWYK